MDASVSSQSVYEFRIIKTSIMPIVIVMCADKALNKQLLYVLLESSKNTISQK